MWYVAVYHNQFSFLKMITALSLFFCIGRFSYNFITTLIINCISRKYPWFQDLTFIHFFIFFLCQIWMCLEKWNIRSLINIVDDFYLTCLLRTHKKHMAEVGKQNISQKSNLWVCVTTRCSRKNLTISKTVVIVVKMVVTVVKWMVMRGWGNGCWHKWRR